MPAAAAQAPSSTNPAQILQDVFGYPAFRGHQAEAGAWTRRPSLAQHRAAPTPDVDPGQGAGHGERLRQLTHRCGAITEPFDDGPTGRIGERLERLVEHAAPAWPMAAQQSSDYLSITLGKRRNQPDASADDLRRRHRRKCPRRVVGQDRRARGALDDDAAGCDPHRGSA